MAEYGNLNYTAAEINADLAKVHDKTAVTDEAPQGRQGICPQGRGLGGIADGQHQCHIG